MGSRMRMVWPRPMGRKPQNENKVTFKKSKEFKLRDWVVEGSVNKDTPCLFEMSFVFTCLKENHFNEKECVDEVKKFRDCYLDSIKRAEALKERKKNPSKIIANVDKLTSAEINAMLAKYKKKPWV